MFNKLRQSLWLESVNQSLYFRVPWRRRRQIVQELRSNLEAANQEVGSEEALRQMGPARHLVESYLENERGRFDLATALIAAFATLLFWMWAGFFVMIVAVDTWELLGSATESLDHTYFGLFEIHASENQFSVETSNIGLPVTMLIAFLVGGKVWRLFTRRDDNRKATA